MICAWLRVGVCEQDFHILPLLQSIHLQLFVCLVERMWGVFSTKGLPLFYG